ncbi:hypothetical protein OC844_005997 [Tilletia horrida]|nr:hypothetical protein OC844_005997 [Tilletia horrida]
MRFSLSSTLLAIAALLAATTPAVSARGRGRNALCANNAPVNATLEAELAGVIAAHREEDAPPSSNQRTAPRIVNVHVHVVTDGTRGRLSSAQVKSQIGVLNKDYYRANYHFNLASTSYTSNASWYSTIQDDRSAASVAMKRYLHRGGRADLNLYTTSLANGILGFATFPWDYATSTKSKYMDGVVIHFQSLPSTSTAFAPYNGGRTATHEIGHWLGLYHPFQGQSCASTNPGDYVSDTPQQQTPTFGCPATKNTCASPGDDLVHNFMDYADDSCMQSFTLGQRQRVHALSLKYRGI